MTKQRTASEIRAYCEAASDGPWYAEMLTFQSWCGLVRDKDDDCSIVREGSETDVAFIANARTDLPRALEAAEKLRAALSYRIMWTGTPEQLRDAEDALLADTVWALPRM